MVGHDRFRKPENHFSGSCPGRYRRLESRKKLSRSTPERHANLLGIFGYVDRRLIQDIAFRYRAASSRNIGSNWPKSMEQARNRRKSLMYSQPIQARFGKLRVATNLEPTSSICTLPPRCCFKAGCRLSVKVGGTAAGVGAAHPANSTGSYWSVDSNIRIPFRRSPFANVGINGPLANMGFWRSFGLDNRLASPRSGE